MSVFEQRIKSAIRSNGIKLSLVEGAEAKGDSLVITWNNAGNPSDYSIYLGQNDRAREGAALINAQIGGKAPAPKA